MSNKKMQLLNDVIELTIDGSVQVKLAELMGILRKNVDSDVQARLKLLEKENAELRKYRDSAEEMQRRMHELDMAIANAEREAQRMRLKKLIEPFMTEAWNVHGSYEYIHEKCDLCDDERKRHFTSPLGREMSEDCVCAEKKWRHRAESVEIVKANGIDDDNVWYYFTMPSMEVGRDDLCGAKIYSGQDFAEIGNCYGVLFLNRETAQNYADYLNERKA